MKITRNFTACWSVEQNVNETVYKEPTPESVKMLEEVFRQTVGAAHLYSFTVEDVYD